MKKLGIFEKFIFFVNSIFAALLLLSYGLPYVFPSAFPSLAVLSLTVPVLILINLCFLIYWLLRRKRQFLLSLICLLIGFNHVSSLYRFASNHEGNSSKELKVMSYNVRLFNLYNWIKDENTESKIVSLVKKHDPDILSLQEFHIRKKEDFANYPYHHIKLRSKNNKAGQAIFSKYRIINSGSLDFPNTNNNGIFVDIIKDTDTLRVYNLHLESLHIDTENQELSQENSERLFKRIGSSFVDQQFQADIFTLHQTGHNYRKVVCGDFNNTRYSYVYKEIKKDMKDAFEEAGGGFGRTFKFKFFPLRIDFIFAEDDMKVKSFQTLPQEYSDHFPIITRLEL